MSACPPSPLHNTWHIILLSKCLHEARTQGYRRGGKGKEGKKGGRWKKIGFSWLLQCWSAPEMLVRRGGRPPLSLQRGGVSPLSLACCSDHSVIWMGAEQGLAPPEAALPCWKFSCFSDTKVGHMCPHRTASHLHHTASLLLWSPEKSVAPTKPWANLASLLLVKYSLPSA